MLSKIGKCQGLADRAEEYAHRLVVDEEKNQGWLWLREPEEFWSFMKPTHKLVLGRLGMDRGIVHLPVLVTPIGRTPDSILIALHRIHPERHPTETQSPNATGGK